jgi:hypothetical protein
MLHALRTPPMLGAAILFVAVTSAAAAEPTGGRVAVAIDQDAGTLTLTVDAQTAFVYRFGPTVDLPHFDPFNSPSGRPMTVAITDPYPHHRSFWVADEKVQLEGQSEKANIYSSLYSGVIDKAKSNWPLAPYKRRVAHVEFFNWKSDKDTVEFDEKLTWKNGDVQLLDELRHYRIRALATASTSWIFRFNFARPTGM